MARYNKHAPVTAQRGISKLKASIRQAKRFLLKENINALLKQSTERRLKALESELQLAERAKIERGLASKYHMVKFFERQKVTRKVNQAKRNLEGDTSARGRRRLEKELLARRIDLNYIIHYPKTKKYISIIKPAEGASDVKRKDIRRWVKECMEKGEMSAEPELLKEKDELESGKGRGPRWQGEIAAVEEADPQEDGAGLVEMDEFFENAEVTPDMDMEGEDGEIPASDEEDEVGDDDDDDGEDSMDSDTQPQPQPRRRHQGTR